MASDLNCNSLDSGFDSLDLTAIRDAIKESNPDLVEQSAQQSSPKPSSPVECPKFTEGCHEMTRLVNMFFDNKFEEAMDGASKYSDIAFTHSHGKAMFKFFLWNLDTRDGEQLSYCVITIY